MGNIPEKIVSEQIKKIYSSEHLSETEKNRLIAELLQQTTTPQGKPELNPKMGYVASFIFPPLGLFIGGRYLIRYGDEGVKPGIICIVLTSVSLVIQLLLFKNIIRALLSGFSSLQTPGI